MSAAVSEIIGRAKISDVYAALGGPKLQGNRGRAFWRSGDGYSVSLNDARGVWHDFVADAGGGILDLIVTVLGGTRADALRWLAEFTGSPLEDRPLSSADRAEWARQQRHIEQNLPAARYWRRAAIAFNEQLLDSLKVGLFEPTAGTRPAPGEVPALESLLARLRRIDGAALVEEYAWWVEHYPGMTAGMVQTSKQRERAEQRALLALLGIGQAAGEEAA